MMVGESSRLRLWSWWENKWCVALHVSELSADTPLMPLDIESGRLTPEGTDTPRYQIR
jgi:hypothetical protein